MPIGPLKKHAQVDYSDFVGAKVFTVTSLSGGTGTGSWRWARDQAKAHAGGRSGTKWAVIEFAVGGVIDFRDGGISYTDGNQGMRLEDCHRMLIFGSSAPSSVVWYGVPTEVRHSTKLIIDGINMAPGPLWADTGQWDGLRIFGPARWEGTSSNFHRPNEDIWVNHCSIRWSNDEAFSLMQTPQFRISLTNCLLYEPFDSLAGNDWDGKAIVNHIDSGDDRHNYGPLISGKGGWGMDGVRYGDPRDKKGGMVCHDFQRNVTGNIALRGPRIEQGMSALVANNLSFNWASRSIDITSEQHATKVEAGRQLHLVDILDNVGCPGKYTDAESDSATSTQGLLRFAGTYNPSSGNDSYVGIAGNKRVTDKANWDNNVAGYNTVEKRFVDHFSWVHGTPYAKDPTYPPGFERYSWNPVEARDYLLRNAGPFPRLRAEAASKVDGFDVAFIAEVKGGQGEWWSGDSPKGNTNGDKKKVYSPVKATGWRTRVPETSWTNGVPERPSTGLATQAYIDHHLARALLDDAPAAPATPQRYDEALTERLSLGDIVRDVDAWTRSTDFSGPVPLDGWSRIDPTWSGAYEVALDPTATGGACLRQTNATRARKHLVWTAAGIYHDGCVRSKVKAGPVAAGGTPDTAAGVMARVSEDGRSGYYAALSRAGGVRTFRLGKYVNGVATNLGDLPFAWLDGEWYWIEMWLQGTRIRARAWKDGDLPP